MPPVERDVPAIREADRSLRHQHSASSDQGRALIPMWDSSDPERAPPPLPLNPQSPKVGTSRAGTSTAIQAAHNALTEKARENSGVLVPHFTKRMSEIAPERPSRGGSHRRMQSLQPAGVKDLSLMIESGRDSQNSTPRPQEKTERPSTPSRNRERDPFTDDKEERSIVQSPRPGPSLTPIVRPIVRRPHQSILGENTPPQSATMLALQNMPNPTPPQPKEPEAPLANITNGNTTPSNALVRVPQSLETLSTQILSLTNIATSLQKEMSQLSRRSRDNATDLLSLKEATNTRDEDIRKSLRDLIQDNKTRTSLGTRDQYGGHLLLEARPHSSSPPPSISKAMRPFSLPRIPSPNSFSASLDRDTASTPSLASHDSAASIAILERILRDMGTHEGQEKLIDRLAEVADKLCGLATGAKVEELIQFVKANTETTMVHAAGGGSGGNGGGYGRSRNFSFDEDDDGARPRELGFTEAGPMTTRAAMLLKAESRRSSAPAGLVNEDVLKAIRTVKDSVSQGGGLTAEVKALVRELRGEVLGMGRELGRRLDEMGTKSSSKEETATGAEMVRIVDQSLEELKQHMNNLLREHRRQSASSTSAQTSAEFDRLNTTIRAALHETQAHKPTRSGQELSRNDVIHAIRDAWEAYKPELAHHVGLERDEILACLQEGLEAYAPHPQQAVGATREEVFKAVIEGLKHFPPPRVETQAGLSRDEILEAVRECLEEFEFPVAPSAIGAELSKEDMVDAVQRGIESFGGLPAASSSRSIDLSRDDMIDAVREGLQSFDFPAGNSHHELVLAVKEGLRDVDLLSGQALIPSASGNNQEIVGRLEEIMEFMRDEFKAVSEESKQNVSANGRDTEQVLDATKDGFEKLRADMVAYVERVSGQAGQEQLMATLVHRLDSFQDEVADLVATSSRDMLKEEVEALRDAMNSSLVPAGPQGDYKEILHALQDGLSSLRTEISTRPVSGMTEILDALSEGLGDIRTSIEKLHNKPTDLTANDEILDALKSGLESVRSDIDCLRGEGKNDKALATVSDDAASKAVIPAPADILKHEDIKNLEVLITQLRIKVEAMEPTTIPTEDSLHKEDIVEMEEMIRNVQESVAGMATKDAPTSSDPASREDVQAIETILRNTKACLDDLIEGEQAVRKDHIDTLEALILETKGSIGDLVVQMDVLSRKEDINAVESLVTQVVSAFDEMKERHEKALEDPEKVTKTDVDAIEAVCLDVKSCVEQMVKADLASLPTRDDLKGLEQLVKEFKDHLDIHAASNAKAFEERQAETVGVSDRVTEVKTFLEEFQGAIKSKVEEGAEGLGAVNKLLETMNESLTKNATVGDDLKEMFDTIKGEFEESRAGVVGAKLDTDEKFQETTDTLVGKIDARIDELVLKYEEFQASMEERATKGEARDIEMEAAVVGTKAIADELKSLIDTLGTAVTDSMEKMEEASKTVFDRVEDMVTKADELHSDDKAEHQMTRDQVKEAIGIVEGVQGHVVEYQPKILEAIKDVLAIVDQHYEHSKNSTVTIQEKIEEAKPPEQPLLPEIPQYDDTVVHEKLDRLVAQSDVTDKALAQLSQLETLDKVHNQVNATASELSGFLTAQTQRIADEHEDREKTLQETALSLERKLAQQEQVEASLASLREEEQKLKETIENRIRDEEERRERRLREEEERTDAILQRLREEEELLHERMTNRLREEEEIREKRLREEEERKEAILSHLRDEEARLRDSIVELRGEQETMNRQKMRLAGDVSSLETALRIRREELHEMDVRAEALERRILEGVMDHSRVLLMTKATKANGSDAMSRKRTKKPNAAVADNAGAEKQTKPKSVAIAMAMSGNRNLAPPSPAGSARRILSLSQINSNVPAGGFKRSQSVRTPGGAGALRKSSWAGGRPSAAGAAKGYGDLGGDKENMNLPESDEEHRSEYDRDAFALVPAGMVPTSTESIVDSEPDLDPPGPAQGADDHSDTETLRRSSRGTVVTGTESYTGTEDYSDYSDDETRSEWTESNVGTESIVSGSESIVSSEGGGGEVVLFEN
ncbi:hypothetical protein GQ53DRAFT_746042 [Thozetella sp. PMI_491]|nr:hypothetical protein GQ53DRAFT_746042 [Thozetella sp. PMI_491]